MVRHYIIETILNTIKINVHNFLLVLTGLLRNIGLYESGDLKTRSKYTFIWSMFC